MNEEPGHILGQGRRTGAEIARTASSPSAKPSAVAGPHDERRVAVTPKRQAEAAIQEYLRSNLTDTGESWVACCSARRAERPLAR